MVTTERVPAKVRASDGVGSLEQLEGQVTAVDLVPGEQLVRTRFVLPAQLVEQSGVEVPEGLQEVTIAVDPQRAVGGQIRPGSLVGVLASFVWEDDPKRTTKMNNQRILVTNVQVDQAAAPAATDPDGEDGGDGGGPATAPTGSLLVTLAVDTEDAELIVFAAEHGTVWLTAQNEATETGGSEVRHGGNVYDD
jgi:pilus assembly protein CpaB